MKNFYSSAEAAQRYGDIIPVYQAAFADPPWSEVTKCADVQQRCPGGLGAVALGAECGVCEQRPTQPAYPDQELTARFDALSQTRPVSWYLETCEQGLTLAALAWPTTVEQLANEKYAGIPAMQDWLADRFGEADFVWLDEVFADRTKQARGNLRNFGQMCLGFGEQLGCDQLAYRTIAPQMLVVPQRDFGERAQAFAPEADSLGRSVVTINLTGASV